MAEQTIPPCLVVVPLQSGFWRMRVDGGEKLLNLYYKEAAVHFALSWAKKHQYGKVHVYDSNAKSDQIIPAPPDGLGRRTSVPIPSLP
jgi:hypothetical protein